MNDESATEPTVTSPVATGGGGTAFEQHVDALFLALLLVRAPLPILKDCQVEQVHLQTEHLGWQTDDVLVIAKRVDGTTQRLAAQVKRQFTISEKDKACRKVFADFWADFRADGLLNREFDRFALITLRGTNVLLNDFNSLLDCARASLDGEDFTRRLETEGLVSKTARGYATAIRSIIDDLEGSPVAVDEFWRFVTVIHLLSLDLNTSSAQNEAWIKCLLAQSSTESDALEVAGDTWRRLLELVGEGMARAASYTYEDLPEEVRLRHGPVSTAAEKVIQALRSHSDTTLNGIKVSIAGSTVIERERVTMQVIDALARHQVVVVSGPAGSGKSALAKRAIETLRQDVYAMAFRAEEFAVSHIDQALQQAQIPVNGRDLLGLLAGQGKKTILIESIERLLEAPVRDAFSDLLNLAQEDGSLGLLLTCRDYSLDTVGSALLGRGGLGYSIVDVPPLSGDELEEVSSQIAGLGHALEHPGLKKLLRSPYLLDKAAQMDWSGGESLPNDEQEFRKRCWGEVIRRDEVAGEAMPQRRERTFEAVAVRRAQELRPYVGRGDLDSIAVDALKADGLLTVAPESSELVAPAHDVLEDWAIIQWLGSTWALHEGAASALAEAVGGYPAIRRGFRRWLTEMLVAETDAAADFVLSVFKDDDLPAYFRDDALVCTLQSAFAREFLERHRETLLAEEARLLVRVIHLLRVACKTTPRWIREGTPVPSLLLVPVGDAWSAVLELVAGALEVLVPAKTGLLLGLVEDWANRVNWQNPEPEGFRAAGQIAYAVLGVLDGYRMDDMRKRALKVIAKIPTADEGSFRDLIDRACAGERTDRGGRELVEILLKDVSAGLACRAFPGEIIRLCQASFCLSETDLEPGEWGRGSRDIEPYFGIKEHSNMDYVPASAIRGPFTALLQHHPQQGVEFVIELINHAGTWYGEQKWPIDPLEPAWEIVVEIPGEEPIRQWANPRLWGLFRGMSVGPYVLQTALMALEAWLLRICEIPEVDAEAWLLNILRETNNVAMTAVVASVCNAHPEKGGRAALAVLSARDLIGMDRARMVQETSHSAMSGIFPSLGVSRIFDNERKESDALSHRGYDLEALAVRLQLGPAREKVFGIIDKHRAALPAVGEQSEEDRLWRLALHRMDVRGFRPVDGPAKPERPEGSTEDEAAGRVYLGPGQIEEDVQELIDRHSPVAAQQELDYSLLNWGRGVWEGRVSPHIDPGTWRAMLAKARDREEEPEEFARGGPGFIAAVCVRDHWEEMEQEDRQWCAEKLLGEVDRDCDSGDYSIRHARGLFQPDRPSAYLLPRMLERTTSSEDRSRIVEAISKALTHASEEVQLYAAEGIGVHSTGDLSEFSNHCVAAVGKGARLVAELQAAERGKPYGEQLRGSQLTQAVLPAVREAILRGDGSADQELADLDLTDWPGRVAAKTIQQILGHQTDSELAIAFHRRLARSMVDEWDAEREDRERRGRRNHHFTYDCLARIASFVLKLNSANALLVCEPLLAAVEEHPRDVQVFLQSLVLKEDQSPSGTSFWEVWQAFADRICDAPWIPEVDSEYGRGRELVNAIFLGQGWKENIRHWQRLEGNAHRVDALASRLSGSVRALEAYAGFLHDIGELCLPKAFVTVAISLKAGSPAEMLASANVVFHLEALLRRYVYGEPLKLKADPAVRSAVLEILDQLVEAGSSGSYRMRDDFVTPLSARGAES